MSTKLDVDFVKESLNKENYIFLDDFYIDAKTKFKYKCSNGHEHLINWSDWKVGHRCPFCNGNAKLALNKISKEFENAGLILLDTEYINSKQRFNYLCSNGHRHSMRIDHLRRGIGCPYCSGMVKKSMDEIKHSLLKEDYILLSDEYKNIFDKLKIKCNKGHTYKASFHDWLQGHRCPTCNGGIRLECATIKKSIEAEGYRLLTTTYLNSAQILKLECPKGHDYFVNYNNWRHKHCRCTECSGNGASGQEIIIRDYLTKNNIRFKTNNKSLISPYELDIVIPSKKIAIEYCGLYWHSDLMGKDKNYHLNKLAMCNSKGYRLITILEDEFLLNTKIVFSKLDNILNINSTKKICAANCSIKEISTQETALFCNENHLRGYVDSDINLGAYYNNELVSIMTFSKSFKIGVWELSIFCSKINYRTPGISSKLLTYFKKNYEWTEIFSYVDRRWSDGTMYEKLGFVFEKFIQPTCWYFKTKRRIHNFTLRKTSDGLEDVIEWGLRKAEGWNRIWDCGYVRYVTKTIMV